MLRAKFYVYSYCCIGLSTCVYVHLPTSLMRIIFTQIKFGKYITIRYY